MSTLKICRICLRTEAKGYKFERFQLKYFYEEVTALKVDASDDLPQWFCYECAAMLHKFHKFKEKCYIGQKHLKELLWKGPITYEAIYKLDKVTRLQSTLKTITITDKVKTFTIKDIKLESNSVPKNTGQKKIKYSNEHNPVIDHFVNQIKLNIGNIYNLDTESVSNLDTDTVSNLDSETVSNLNKKYANDFKTENDNNLDTKTANTLYTDTVFNLDTDTVCNLGTDNVSYLHTEYANDFKTKNDNNLDTKTANTLDTDTVSNLDTDTVSNLGTDTVCNLETVTVYNLPTEYTNDFKIENDNKLDTKTVNTLDIEISNDSKSNDESLNTVYTLVNPINDVQILSKDISEVPPSPKSILVQGHKILNLISEDLKTNKNKNIEISNSKDFGKYLSENWKKVILTEDEALKEFREKADDPKYLDAAYKCKDCFKGFSKKDMLKRHVQTRHSQDPGYECRFCRMRFKWKCLLRKHIQQHYTKYECLRCHIVFHLDTSALLHEDCHSGATKKCPHCNEEFLHVTTYYTHLRTHRSAHVCVWCGASFVSAAGLWQHASRKHPENDLDSPSDSEDEALESYCARCELRFHSRRAYTEHLFHSDMHTEVNKKDQESSCSLISSASVTPTKKIMGKRRREKITKELRKRKSDLDAVSPPVKAKRRKKVKKKHRKPSTCHQCGEKFSTQAACMKHHTAAHPRTSFHSPYDRYICELCGASLAPGSVAMHQNMHSRETVHTCDSCGRQFHSGAGLKRHLVTHTGEKPFACSLCEKRFTQSNSMKLHYNTFHLKQPYPKRIRKKKKDQPNQSTEQDTNSEQEESDSVPEVPPVPQVPTAPEIPAVLHVVGENGPSLEEENLHYLTLS